MMVEKGPIFVGGQERSGTSLMYALLASHPNLAMTRRTNLWTFFYDQYGDLSQEENFERCLAAMMRYKRLLKLQPDFDRIRGEFWQGEPTYPRLFALIEEQYAQRMGKPRWGDKSLHLERYAPQIFAAYPGARILHMLRDPRDRYASALKRWQSSRGRAGVGIDRWRRSLEFAKRNQQRYPDRYKIVRYETLAANPEETLQEICAFVDEEYTPVMLGMEGAEDFRDAGGNSSYGQRKPGAISTSSIGRFRKVMSRREIAFMQTYGKQDLLAYDYELDPIQLSASDRLLFYVVDWPANFARIIVWRTYEAFLEQKGRKPSPHTIVNNPVSD